MKNKELSWQKRYKRVAAKPRHEEAVNLYNQGLTYQAIAKRIGMCMRTAIRYIDAAYYADEAYSNEKR